MAIECLDRALEVFDSPVYVFHEIVHNQTVVERFQKRGAIFVDSVDEVPEEAVLLYSAHGISPEVRQSATDRKLRAIDATCPLVTKVHLEALRFAKNGYKIILIGHRDHDEVIGTMGEAPLSMSLVENTEDVQKLSFSPGTKLAYLSQTTLSFDDANIIIKALENKFPHIESPPKEDICYATQNRQEAVHALAPQADLVLVLGSQNSSNSQRLVEIAKTMSKPAYLIDGVQDLKAEWLTGVDTVLVTAGASAPEDLVQDCVETLRKEYNAEVSETVLKEEKVQFGLPKELPVA